VARSTRWQRLDAAGWVHGVLVFETVLAGLSTALALVFALTVGSPWLAAIPAALTAFTAWLAHAWDDGRPWTWWVVMSFSALGVAGNLLSLAAGGSPWRLLPLFFFAGVLVLLGHPDSTARLDRRPVARHRDGSGFPRPGRP
jgi:hypothetical protein